MSKAPSPVRLQKELMQAATIAASRSHRSASKQIEHWASLGRQIAHFVNEDTLLKVSMGLARLNVEPTLGQPVDPEAVFSTVDTDSRSDQLAEKISPTTIRYQASMIHPGYLEQIDREGHRKVGTFCNGVFTPLKEET